MSFLEIIAQWNNICKLNVYALNVTIIFKIFFISPIKKNGVFI